MVLERRVAEEDKQESHYALLEANGLFYEHRFEEALRIYSVSSALNPEDARPHFGLGNSYMQLGKYEEALQSYQFGRELSQEEDAGVLYNMGVAHHKLSNFGDAIEFYRKAKEINPKLEAAGKSIEKAELGLVPHD